MKQPHFLVSRSRDEIYFWTGQTRLQISIKLSSSSLIFTSWFQDTCAAMIPGSDFFYGRQLWTKEFCLLGTLRSPMNVNRRFGETCRPHLLTAWYLLHTFSIILIGVRPSPLRPLLACCTSPRWRMMGTVEKLVDLGSNPSRRGGKTATNRLRYGTVF
jgi:hypothetical protein